MRLLASIAFLGLALASTFTWNPRSYVSEQWFDTDREYRYLFDGQIITGMALPKTQQSATRLQAIVTLQAVDDYTSIIKFTQIRFGTLMEEMEPRQLLPFERFQLVKLSEQQKDMLSLPIQFVYRNGIVGDIEFSEEDKPWSVNIKKAVLNMLQINRKKRDEVKENERSMKNTNYFVGMERTLEGECEVEYTINDVTTEQKQWTKSINFEKCNMRPKVQYGMYNSNKMKSDEKLFSTIVRYNVSDNEDKFLIREAELQSQYKQVPLSEKHEMMASLVYNKIILVYSGKTETEIPNVRRDRKESLIYNLDAELAEEKFAMTGDEKYLHRIPEWNNKVEHIEKMLSTLIRSMEEKLDPETSHIFARLVKLLRLCSERELTKIQRFLRSHEKRNYKVLSLYYDALAIAGTKMTVTELVNMITSEKIDSLKAFRLIKSLADVRVPSEEIADQVLSVCESELAERTPYLKQACWLTYGAIFNGICRNGKLTAYHVDNLCKRELKEKFVDKMINLFEKADNRYDKVLMLKSLANAGIETSVYELERIIYNKDEEKTIRIEAINALRKIGPLMPRKVQNILMPIFKNRNESAEVRMSALRRIMETSPEQAVFDQIVHKMENERDQNLRSFIFGVLKSTSELPENNEKAVLSVKKALRTVDVEFYEKLNNRVFRWTVEGEDMKYGTTLNLQTLFTKDSVLPKDFLASLDNLFGEEWYKYFGEFGFSQQNVDEIITKLINKFEDANMEQLVVGGKRSTIHRTADMFKAIYKKLNFVRRPRNKEDPHAMIYIRYMDMDYAFLPLDENTIPKILRDIVRDGKVQLGEIERILATGNQFQNSAGFFFYESVKKIPTSLGLPLMLTYKMPTVATIQGHIKVDLEPKRSAAFNGLRVRLLLKPKIASTHVIRAVAFSPIVESGFKMLHSATFDHPLDAEIEMTLAHKLHLNTVFRPLERKRNVMHIQSRPVTFTRQVKKTTHAYPEPSEITVYLHKQLYPLENFEYNYLKKYGTLLKVAGTIHRQVVSGRTESVLNPLLVGYNTLDVIMEPTQDMAKQYVFMMEIESFVPDTMEKPALERFFRNNDEFFAVEVEEFEPRRNEEHKSHLSTYLRNLNDQNAYKHRLFLKFETVGQRNKNEMEMELKAICDEKYRFCRTRLLAHSTPQEMESRNWQMNVEVQTMYPETPKSLRELREQLNREFYGFIDATWGSMKKNSVFIRMQGEQSREQKVWMKNLNPDFENKLTEMQKLKLASNLNFYKLAASYQLSSETKNYLSKVFSLLKTLQNSDSEYNQHIVNNQEGLLRAQLNIEPLNRRTFDLLINTPQSRIFVKNAVLPIRLPTVTVDIDNSDVVEFAGIKNVISHAVERNRAECVVKSENVKTFDDLLFKTSLTTCYTIIAKDCTNEEPKFVVLMKKLKKKRNDKKLKLITRENMYEIEMLSNELVSKVNGREFNRNQMEQYGLKKIYDNLYRIDTNDISVVFDGFQANIKLSQLYKNKQCGLCGHYDGEKWNDLRRADNEETTAVQDFHRSYITNVNECDYEESELEKDNRELEMDLKNRNYRRREREEKELRNDDIYDLEKFDDERDSRNPIPRTRVVEREQRVCFSVEPVLDCPKYTMKDEVREKEVNFVCLRSSNRETKRLLRKAREEVIPRSILQGENWSTVMPIPKTCTAY